MYQDDRNEESCTLIDAKRQSLRDYVACDVYKREREFEKKEKGKRSSRLDVSASFSLSCEFLIIYTCTRAR